VHVSRSIVPQDSPSSAQAAELREIVFAGTDGVDGFL
jgi:hypothetical protein